ncbi:hypothetical protein H0H87_005177 [Tephrocybe sp. NHM501043]|nr:hypothetical protein H0H87_005177 [Tephrocybe sp. NHM501043]
MPPRDSQPQYASEPLYGPAGGPMSQAIPLHGPVSHPDGPRDYAYSHVQHLSQFSPHPPAEQSSGPSGSRPPTEEKNAPHQDYVYAEQLNRGPESQPPSPGQDPASNPGGAGANHYPSSTGVPRLPPIMQVEKQQVTTSATQLASASRRRNEAHFVCPVPGCGSTFTRRFNLRGWSSHEFSSSSLTPYEQVISGRIRKRGRTYASGPVVKRALRVNMTANTQEIAGVTKHFTPRNHKTMSAVDAKKHLAAWML